MIQAFSEITIEVPNLARALDDYQAFLGSDITSVSPLRNVAIRLLEAPQLSQSRIASLGLLSNTGTVPANCADTRGLVLPLASEREIMPPDATTAHGICAVDHIVLMTGNADDCIRLFGEEGFGLRLALDQLVPEWGGRMLFFRCGKMTLEIIHNLDKPPSEDGFWGITYFCEELETTLALLDENGVEHSEIRKGRKPGTRVATIKSHNLGLPTLLIEPENKL